MFFANETSAPSVLMYWPTAAAYTTVYETVLPAACETSSWLATYTITETCAGNPANHVTPTIPPGFVVTTVTCGSCAKTEIEITCPGTHPTGIGMPTVHIEGNGVTATAIAWPHPAPGNGGMPGPTAVPTRGGGQMGNSGNGSSSGNSGNSSNNGNNGNGNSDNGMGRCSGNCNGNEGGKNGTMMGHPMPYTGDAVTVKRSLMVGVGVALMAGPLLLL
ncbi:hypothetical protein F4861DRAFT_343538 [Xylaria intraflava]|nr:hypothetical protein F4861DRAFT_343538 [Xylaria intraflava]